MQLNIEVDDNASSDSLNAIARLLVASWQIYLLSMILEFINEKNYYFYPNRVRYKLSRFNTIILIIEFLVLSQS